MNNKSDLKFKNLGFGAGFRRPHQDRILNSPTRLNWFEVISENYFGLGDEITAPAVRTLERLRAAYPVALHGVSLSIGSVDPVNPKYLQKLKALADRIEPSVISDHLCWTGVNGNNLHDLLPLPYDRATIQHVAARIQTVQDHLKRRILIENVSSYLTYTHSEMDEWDFISELAEAADCGILLDINNIYVSARNHGFDPKKFIDRVPMNRVGQVHLAGHSDEGTHLIDTHDHPVCDDVWSLFRYAAPKLNQVSIMVEWDDKIPEFEVLENEVLKAAQIIEAGAREKSVTL